MWVGPDTCKLAVVSESMPWWSEPFDGPSGKLFRESMTEVGIGVEKVAFGFASDDPQERGAGFLVLAGDGALGKYRSDLRVAHCHGRPMQLPSGVLGYPVFHPEAYWRNPRWRSLLLHELRLLMRVASSGDGWHTFVPQSCVKCRGTADFTDMMGVVYCNQHKP